jgi:hypothetical protein
VNDMTAWRKPERPEHIVGNRRAAGSFGGIPVLYLVLAEFSFHVPTKGSAAIDTPANARRTNMSLL